ncbi:MAG: hypothetical protein HY711_08070 [Candidatus Melainabacteria bacterium]|nr:hypothetical protein [Candidatus Melainabacteria bacterium]
MRHGSTWLVFIAMIGLQSFSVGTVFAQGNPPSLPSAQLHGAVSYTEGKHDEVVLIRMHGNHSNLLVFTEHDQVFTGEAGGGKDVLLRGSAGAVLSLEHDMIVPHRGSFVVDTGKNPVRLATSTVGVKIEPQSTAIIDFFPKKVIRVVAVAGGNSEAVKVRTSAKPDEVTSLRAGKEFFIVYDKAELVAGAYRVPRAQAGMVDISSIRTAERCINISQVVKQEPLLVEWQTSLTGSKKVVAERFLSHVRDSVGAAQREQSYDSTSYHSVRTPRRLVPQCGEPLRFLAADGTDLMLSGSREVSLLKGSLYLNTPAQMTIKTPLATVFADKSSLVSAEYKQGRLRVQACSGPDDVCVVCGQYKIPLKPGAEVLLADHYPTQQEVYGTDGIGRRCFNAFALGNSVFIVKADFSIASMLLNVHHLKSLRRPWSTDDKHLLESLLKTAAAIEYVTRGRGGYFVLPKEKSPEVAACVQQ